MSIFSKLFAKEEPKKESPAAGQSTAPHAGWPWTLTVNGVAVSRFDWADIDLALRELEPDPDSFLILEQKDPADPQRYWYLQSAVASQGPHAGYSIVGCGFSGPDGRKESRKYYERILPWVGDVTPLFQAVWQGQPLDLSQFSDASAMLF